MKPLQSMQQQNSSFPLLCGPEFLPAFGQSQKNLLSGKEELLAFAKEAKWQDYQYFHDYFIRPNIAIVLTDITERILWINSYFTRMSGYLLPEIKGSKPSEVLQGSGTSDETRKRLKTSISSHQELSDCILNYKKDGSAYWCKLDIWPLFNTSKELTHFIAFEQEVSQQQLEEITPL